jgi:hypothetical protein
LRLSQLRLSRLRLSRLRRGVFRDKDRQASDDPARDTHCARIRHTRRTLEHYLMSWFATWDISSLF